MTSIWDEFKIKKKEKPQEKETKPNIWDKLYTGTKPEKPEEQKPNIWAGFGIVPERKPPELQKVKVEEEEPYKKARQAAKKEQLKKGVIKGLTETAGFVEAPYSLATGMTGWIGGLLAVPTKMIYDAWRSGGRDVSFSRAEKAMEDVMNFMSYRPETELGQTLTEVAAAPFTTYLELMGKGVEKITDDEEKQAALRILGNYALLLLPKFVKGGKALLNKRLKSGKSITGSEVKAIAKEAPKTIKETIEKIPDDMDISTRPLGPEGKVEAGGLAFGMKLPERIANVRIDKINSNYDVKKTLTDIANQVKSEIDTYREPVTWTARERLAKELGMTVDELMKKRKGKVLDATEMEAARRLQGAAMVEVNKAMKAYAEDPSSANLINFRASVERGGLIVRTVSEFKAETARALNILRKAYEPGEFRHRAMEKVLRLLGGEEKNIEIFEKMAVLDWSNPAEISKFLRDVTKPKLSDMVFEVWINALLSGIPTQVRNVASNTLNLLTKPIETGIAAAVEAPKRLVGKEPEVYFGEVPYQIVGIFNGLPEGVRKASYAWTHEMPMEGVSKLEVRHRQAIPGKVGKAVRIPGRALMSADEFFKAIVYTSDIHGMAYRRATAEGLRGKALIERFTELVRDPDKVMMDHATGEMLYRTFQKELGKWGKATQKFRESIEPIRWIVPFMRVSINIPKYAFERTPFNLPRILYKAIKGHYKGAEFAENVSRPLIGSLASIGVFIEAMKGNITGSGPTDRNERRALYRQGWLPYSMKISGKYYSYAGIEPLATMFGVTADMAEVWQGIEEGEKDNLASKLVLAFTENITNKTFMRGVSEALNAISDPERYGEHWLSTFAGTAVPTGAAYVARARDPYFRDVRSLLDQLKSRIPGLSETLPPKRDLWGRAVERKGSFIEKLMSPVWVSEEDITDVDQELNRLKYFPGMPQRKIRDVELTPEQYNEFVEMAGRNTYLLLAELIKMEGYQHLSDEEKLKAIKRVLTATREIGRLSFLSLNPTLIEKLRSKER